MTELCNAQHWVYMLTCDEYEALHAAQGGCCGVCGLPEEQTTVRQLAIDHEHGGFMGYWAVRGLLCGSCNGSLRARNDAPNEAAVRRYLDNAWWKQFPPVMDEPPVGTVLRGRWGGRYERLPDSWLLPKRSTDRWPMVLWAAGPYLRLARDAEGQSYYAPTLTKPRRLASACLSRRRSPDRERTPERMTRPALIAEVRRLRRLVGDDAA